MSTSMTERPMGDKRRPGPRPDRYHGLGLAVGERAVGLQARSLKDGSDAVASLARLRRGVGAEPGVDPALWEDTIGLVPVDELGRGDAPSPAEQAAHVAMTLFALHRQGKCERAHVRGVSFGEAMRLLSLRRASPGEQESEGVRRRFDAALTATTPSECAHHLRGLVLMLRDQQIGLDYGEFTVDLADLWSTWNRNRVRLRWARAYRRADHTTDQISKPSGSPTPSSTTEEQK